MITIIDYGMGNIGSVANMLRKIGAPAVVSSDPDVIRRASKLILPGVGAFDVGMSNLRTLGLIAVLNEVVLQRAVPLLGICLGMQLLTKSSEEGNEPGLGWFDARTVRFRLSPEQSEGRFPLRVPHMGWKTVAIIKTDSLFRDLEGPRFYFVHSYHVACLPEDTVATARHGNEFVAAIQKGNVCGVQFHPEKSHKFGLRLLANFAEA